MNELDQKLRDYYEAQQLSDERLDEILASAKVSPQRFPRPAQIWLAAAAALALLLGITALLLMPIAQSVEQSVVAQVEKYHRKQLPPEILSSDFLRIQTHLPRLKFPIAPTHPEFLAGLAVVGGRYCSVLDELAAQISLTDESGQPCTLYVAPLTVELAEVDPGDYRVGDTSVQIWRDAHRLFALARPEN